MASNSSGKLNPSQTYTLGNYTFRLIINYDSSENITSVMCHASDGTNNKQTGKDYPGRINVESWKVDAEDRTATVYITTHYEPIDISPVEKTVPKDVEGYVEHLDSTKDEYIFTTGNGFVTVIKYNDEKTCGILASSAQGTYYKFRNGEPEEINRSYTYAEKTVYYVASPWGWHYASHIKKVYPDCKPNGLQDHQSTKIAQIAWHMIYGDPVDEDKLICKFEINMQDADAGNWDIPGDTGEPSKTLHISVTGALSGRHNDPLHDTSYHYTPSDREQADIYGSGGVGGSGGAGGAGASTVIIYNCATDKAGYTEEIAIAKRHGYGSGAGKGGKGGDGCILVYY